MSPCSEAAGFSVVEILVSIVIVALLVCVAVPAVGTIRDDGRVTETLELIAEFEKAVRIHHEETGRPCVERSDRDAKWISAHHLTSPQGYLGWSGPYLSAEMARGEDLFGGDVLLYDDIAGGLARPYSSSFRLGQGISARRYQGAGQFLALTKVPEDLAREIDEVLDDGEVGDWRRRGRVQWRSANQGTLMVLLLDL
ncbi:MAG: hypothetical protein V3W41_10135 [Planctomycetota bacterium]